MDKSIWGRRDKLDLLTNGKIVNFVAKENKEFTTLRFTLLDDMKIPATVTSLGGSRSFNIEKEKVTFKE